MHGLAFLGLAARSLGQIFFRFASIQVLCLVDLEVVA